MKNFKKTIAITALLATANCAATYKVPEGKNIIAKSKYDTSYNKILKKTKRTLALEGYQISHFDKEDGIIFTSYKNYKLTPRQANCGKTMGLDYLKDKRTKTEVSFNAIINNVNIIIKGTFRGEYKPGGWTGTQNINLTCISKGVLERELLNKILN